MSEMRARHVAPTHSNADDSGVVAAIKSLDFFPKDEEEVIMTSATGGLAAVIAVLAMLLLAVSEISSHSSIEKFDALSVDRTGLDNVLPLRFIITLSNLSCHDVHVDFIDEQGSSTLIENESTHNKIIKEFLLNGVPTTIFDNNYCGSCYEADGLARCCNTCRQLKQALRQRLGETLETDALANSKAQCNQACRVSASVSLRRTRGNFHIAAGDVAHESHGDHEHHLHRLRSEDFQSFNTSHEIERLLFGRPFPGLINPLDLFSVSEKEPLSQHTYFINVVPTVYRPIYGAQIETNQYSFTTNRLPITLGTSMFPLPGIFFKYDIEALQIEITERPKSVWSLLTRLIGILGGIWVSMGLLVRVVRRFGRGAKPQAENLIPMAQ